MKDCAKPFTAFPCASSSGLRMTRSALSLIAALVLATLWLPWLPAAAQTMDGVRAGSTVTPAVLESKIAEVEAAIDLADEAKLQLIELYRKALNQIETTRANENAIEEYRLAGETAPAQLETLREATDPENIPPPLANLLLSQQQPLEELVALLQKEQADLGAVTARKADFEARLGYNEGRPTVINQRLAEATEQREAVAAQLQLPPAEGASLVSIQAKRWALETEYQALSTEIKLLDQELLTRPIRMKLLQAKRDREEASIAWITTRVEAINEVVNRKRQQVADEARIEAERAQRATAGMDPLLGRLSERNAALSKEINAITDQLQGLDSAQAGVSQLIERIDADYADARETIESGELSGELGTVLLEQRRALPDLLSIKQRRKQRRAQISGSNVHLLRYRAEERRTADLDEQVAALEDALQQPLTPYLREALRNLVQQRRKLIGEALQAHELYLTKQRELAASEDQLIAATVEYEDFLVENVLWLRSEAPTGINDLRRLPAEVGTMLAAADLSGLADTAFQELAPSPAFWLALVLAVALTWLRRRLLEQIHAIANRVGKPTTDGFGLTLRTLGLTLLIAAPLPLLMAVIGLHLMLLDASTELPRAVGDSLLRIAMILYTLLALAAICLPRGLARVHFLWPESNVVPLRRDLTWLIWLFPTAGLAFHLAIDFSPVTTGGTPARLFALPLYAVLVWFLFRLFHPRRGVLAQARHSNTYPLLMRTYWLWYPLLLLIPMAFALLGLAGYIHTVVTEAIMYLNTLWLMLGMVLTNALALRWLMVTRRRLAYEAALERRRAMQEAARAEADAPDGHDVELPFEEPQVDLMTLSAETRELIRTVVSVAGLIGLYLIWEDALPALRILDDFVLWHSSVTVDGTEQAQPVTLAAAALALIYGIAAWLLATRMPALIELALLRRFDMAPSSRYTVTALTTYVIVAIGILLVLSTLGARWSQLQWLVAALTVGIGFGLQEIVANFVSGLIILFERPIRLGDAVTVGDTDGIVTKIKIRATTVRNWDGKELLVPNKEFITGRLLNWSLSDPTTRLVLSVGVAYGSPIRKAMELMEQAAQENHNVLDDPGPTVTFDSFGDNALGLVLRCFVGSVDLRFKTASALNEAINEKFTAAGITIAFPQRDVHVDSQAPLRVRIEHAGENG
ncbi:MAG: mechanosensitive ion channel [Thiohalocapsa sp. PB-PSB1]|nr:MAG: mechanosensitive ion channel [Thiohalocapsa sp. PB-PSB1]